MEVLAQIPMFDADPFVGALPNTGPIVGTTCSAAYAQLEKTNPAPTPPSTYAPYAPYPPIDMTQWKSVSQERWTFEATTLRGAGQLLHDLVRESVYSDLAGSAANSAAAADPTSGQTLGLGLNATQPYNSLAHVARVLMGRWDNDLYNPDPQCREPAASGSGEDYLPFSPTLLPPPVGSPPNATSPGATELALLPTFADPGTRARANDLGVLTQSQSLAATLFEEAGLVVTDGAGVDLGSALLTQLQGIKAASLGTTTTLFASSVGGQALAQLVASLSTSDLARAAQHNSTTFSLVTLQPTSGNVAALTAAATAAGLTLSTITNGALSANGIAIQGGLSRGLVATDPMARTGPVMIGSQCQELGSGSQGTPTAVMRLDDTAELAPDPINPREYPGTATGYAFAPFSPVFSRQDVFSTANAIRNRLVKLDANATASVNNDPTSTAAHARLAAIAEIGAWAGSGRMILSTDQTSVIDGTYALPSTVYLDLIDVNPADFGLTDLSQLGIRCTTPVFLTRERARMLGS
jgi:hypothetical protein